jgi:hypothetical protein
VKLLRTRTCAVILVALCLVALWGCGPAALGKGSTTADRMYNALQPRTGEAIEGVNLRVEGIAVTSPALAPTQMIYSGPRYGTVLMFADGSTLKLNGSPDGVSLGTLEISRK